MQIDTREPSFLLKASVQFPSPSPQVKTWGDFIFCSSLRITDATWLTFLRLSVAHVFLFSCSPLFIFPFFGKDSRMARIVGQQDECGGGRLLKKCIPFSPDEGEKRVGGRNKKELFVLCIWIKRCIFASHFGNRPLALGFSLLAMSH